MTMHIHWEINRLDGSLEPDPAKAECLIMIEGTIEYDGQPAGLIDAFYLYAEDPESSSAFMELWDLDATTCKVFEEICTPKRWEFRDPIPAFLGFTPGLLCVNFIALRPAFRRLGLGLQAMAEVIRNFADDRVDMVLLRAQPLQHLPHGYDHFDEEVRDLPWNSQEEDTARLVKHFLSWDMHSIPDTHYLLAAPETLCPDRSGPWYPSLLCDE